MNNETIPQVDPPKAVVEARGLDLTFQTKDSPIQALKDVSLTIEQGDFVSFIGPSGCGKTTFLRCIAALEQPTGGSLTVNGMTPDEAKLWFGIISLIVVEMGLITPPVGLNVFIINSMAKDVPMIETFKGVIPFFASDIVRVAILVLFPAITLIVPQLLA